MKIDLSNLAMTQDIAIVELYKTRTYKEPQKVLDDEKNVNKDPKKDIMALKTVDVKVNYNYQTVKILAIKDNGVGLEVGDIAVVDYRKLRDFDMQKGAYIVNIYELIARLTSPDVAE